MKKLISLAVILSVVAIMVSCHKNTPTPAGTVYLDLPATPYSYFGPGLPVDSFDQKATLGRVLFYDGHLSLNNTIACASCHKQQYAFADNAAFSTGFEGRKTARNSKGIQNLAVSNIFTLSNIIRSESQPMFWDGRENILMNLVNRPITNHVEMGITDPADLPGKLATLPIYTVLFNNAYGDNVITSDRISECISIFMSAIKTGNSKFEQSRSTGNTSGLTALELQGEQLFTTKYNCDGCHHIFIPQWISGISGWMKITLT